MAQSRKKAILEQVEKQRRRNRIITLAAIVLIAIVIVTVVITLPRGGNAVGLPDYLNRCVVTTLLYHSHPGLTININGTNFPVPPGVGIDGSCLRPLHTHPLPTNPSVWDGAIHVETDANRDYTLGDFFLIWAHSLDNPTLAILNQTQIFSNRAVSGHTLTMTVNGNPDTSFQNYVFPRNACDSSSTCIGATTNQINIAITYS